MKLSNAWEEPVLNIGFRSRRKYIPVGLASASLPLTLLKPIFNTNSFYFR
jgi:hypothetical protein